MYSLKAPSSIMLPDWPVFVALNMSVLMSVCMAVSRVLEIRSPTYRYKGTWEKEQGHESNHSHRDCFLFSLLGNYVHFLCDSFHILCRFVGFACKVFASFQIAVGSPSQRFASFHVLIF